MADEFARGLNLMENRSVKYPRPYQFRGLVFSVLLASAGIASAAGVTGTIVFEGTPPKLMDIKMDSDPACAAHNTPGQKVEVLVLGEGQTMANVFVRVISGPIGTDHPVPTEPVILDQRGCIYVPHVFGIRAGQPLKILNSDGTLHNVHAFPETNAGVNLAMPKTRTELTHVFEKPEYMFPIKCDVHPWMGAFCAVMDHPFWDVSGIDGKFAIEGLNAGTYEIEAWHEKLGTRTATLTVTEDETAKVDFSFAVPGR
jgi:plastocyanin